MTKYLLVLILGLSVIGLSGCSIRAEREGDTLILRGLGAKKATWPDGASIEQEEPLKVPDILPQR